MKKGDRITPLKVRAEFHTVLGRSQSTSNVLATQQRLVGDIKRFPETLARHTPLRGKLISRNASVPYIAHDPVIRLSRAAQPQGTRSVPAAGSPVYVLKSNGTPTRKIQKTPPRYQSHAVLPPPTPLLLKQKLSMPDLRRPSPLMHIDFDTEPREPSRAISRRKPSAATAFSSSQALLRKDGSPSNAQLGELPNTISRISFKTRTGSIGGKLKPHNQDNFLLVHDFNGTKNQRLFAVFDGHGIMHAGIHGHDVSAYIKTHLTAYLDRALPKFVQMSVQQPMPREVTKALSTGLCAGVLALNQDLVRKTQIETSFSGSTAVIVIVRGTTLVTANVGDSRAVMGRKTEYGWKAVELSHDQKPDNPAEMERICASGGRVQPFVGRRYTDPATGAFIGPARVWMQQEPIPGLAMARSIGDFVASQLGVISEPEVLFEECKPEDKFLILASDGVWEFMPNQRVSSKQCVELVAPFWEAGDIDGACDAVVRESVALWKKVRVPQSDEVVDDITVLMAFLAC